MQERIKEIKNYGLKALGKEDFLRHLNGEALTRGEAISAKCYDCCCHYADGKADCEMPECPLYGFMPYKNMTRDVEQIPPSFDLEKAPQAPGAMEFERDIPNHYPLFEYLENGIS
jgi:hypothetical protein